MFNRTTVRTFTVALTFSLAGAAGMYTLQSSAAPQKAGEKDKEKTKGELPAVVKAAADKFFGTSYTHKTNAEGGTTQFQCTGIKDDKETEAVFTESGDLIIIRKFMKANELPAAALANFRGEYKDAKVSKVAQVETHYYTITFDQNGKEQRVKTYPNGKVWKHSELD